MKRCCFLQVLVVWIFSFTPMAFAQLTTATVLGTISDATGAVIPGATVTVRNTETGISRTITSDAAGRYRIPQLIPGSYEVTAEATGFQTTVRSGITLTVGREAVVDFALEVGAVAERITVTGEAPLVNATSATIGSLVDQDTVRDIPLKGRNMTDLVSLQPGVIADLPSGQPTQAVFTGGGGVSKRVIGGVKPQLSLYLLDGVEISTPSTGTPLASVLGQQLGVDSIREFTLLQSNYGAQYGRASGGVMNAVTQSGTNDFHGGVFEFLRNNALDGKDFFLPPTQPEAPNRRNQFGASLGGPIQKDRTFFFLNYEGLRQTGGIPFVGRTLTDETRNGFITNCPLVNGVRLSSCPRSQAEIPATATPVNPDIKPVMALFPRVNGDYGNAGVGDYNSVPAWTAEENYGIVRIDQQISEKDSLFGRFTIDRSSRTDEFQFQTPAPFKGFQFGRYMIAAIAETHVFSPAVLNNFRIGFSRRNDDMFNTYTSGGPEFPDAPGLDPRLFLINGEPFGQLTITGTSLYNGQGYSVGFTDNVFSYADSMNINRGGHAFAIGASITRYQEQDFFGPWTNGWMNWQGTSNFLRNVPFSLTQFIGTVTPGSLIPDNYRGFRQTYGAFYVQDDFTVFPGLTLNLGLRWEKITGPSEVNGKVASFVDPYNDPQPTLLGRGHGMFDPRDGLKGLSPRVGFAWSPLADQKSVFRGGIGFFKAMPLEYEFNEIVEAPPYSSRIDGRQPALKFPYPFRNAAGQEDASILTANAEPVVIARDLKMSYSIQWTFSVERQLGESSVLKANYLGSRGINLIGIYNPVDKPTEIRDGRPFTPTTAKSGNPFFPSLRYNAPFIDQWYQSGQLVFEQRYRAGFRLNASYTFSRNIDTASSAGHRGADSVGGTPISIYNSNDFAQDKSLSGLHVKHNFIASYTYELPLGSGRLWGNQWTGVLDYLLGGWTINGVHTWRTGLPVNIGITPRQSRCAACSDRPDLIPGGNNNPVLDNWTPEKYFDPSQFVLQAPGFYGNVGRQTLIRPGIFNWDFSLFKDIRLSERTALQFRSEFFNFLNHPNFGFPSATIFRDTAANLDPNVGRITTTSTSMRQIQFGLKFTF